MDEPTKQPIQLPTVQIEVRGDELVITPAKAPGGAEVRIPIGRLDRWAAKIYREEVLA